MKMQIIVAVAATLMGSSAVAQADSFFKPVAVDGLSIAERPYPYAIRDVAPGMSAQDGQTVMEAATGATLVAETVSGSVVHPNGRSINYSFPQSLSTVGGVSLRMAKQDYEIVNLGLATGVLDGAIMSVSRGLLKPATSMPEPAALRAQIEETYGPPTVFISQGNAIKMVYYWSEGGFIENLDLTEEATIDFEGEPGNVQTFRYRPCTTVPSGKTYRFKSPRREPFMPGCVAMFSVEYQVGASKAQLTSVLEDYELMRANRAEADRQILDFLNNSDDVKASDLDL